jgi:surface carbohydrate biosynthesis protein
MTRPTVDVLIVIELPARELETACLIRHYLERRHGLTVRIACPRGHSHGLLARLCPRVICLPQFRLTAKAAIGYWWDGVPVVNLAWEQILSEVNLQANVPKDDFARREVHHTAWGRAYADHLMRHGVPADKVHVVGSPNFGLLEEPFRFLCRDRATLAREYQLDSSKTWLFFPENYGWAFLTDQDLMTRVREGYYTREHALAYRDFQQRNLRKMADWLRAVAPSGTQIILRPRPITPPERFAEVFDGHVPPHVSIIKDGTAREWVLASDAVVSNYSTVLVDAAVAGKPACNLRTETFPDFLHAEFLDCAPSINSPDELRELCQDPESFRTRSYPLREYGLINFHTPGNPFERLAGLIATLRRQATSPPKYLHGRGWYRWDRSRRRWIPPWLRRTASLALRGTRLPEWPAGEINLDAPVLTADQSLIERAKELLTRIERHLDLITVERDSSRSSLDDTPPSAEYERPVPQSVRCRK